VLSRFVILTALRLAATLSPRAQRALAKIAASIQYRASPLRRAAVHENLERIGGACVPRLLREDERERTARAIFESYHRFFLEFLAQRGLARRGLSRQFRFQGMETLYRALACGRGAVVTAPHLGNWEWGGLALRRLGFRVHVVTGVQLHRALTDAVRALKEDEGITVSTPRDGFRPLLATLHRGGLVLLLVDGDVYTRGIQVPFFGRPVPFPAGPAILARRSGAPLLHAHASREDGGAHRISFDGADEPDLSLPLSCDLRRLTARVAAAQERNIARHVAQWCVFRPMWGAARAARVPRRRGAD
jgi:KDO2-lipid IV(A) lauroyltransferase